MGILDSLNISRSSRAPSASSEDGGVVVEVGAERKGLAMADKADHRHSRRLRQAGFGDQIKIPGSDRSETLPYNGRRAGCKQGWQHTVKPTGRGFQYRSINCQGYAEQLPPRGTCSPDGKLPHKAETLTDAARKPAGRIRLETAKTRFIALKKTCKIRRIAMSRGKWPTRTGAVSVPGFFSRPRLAGTVARPACLVMERASLKHTYALERMSYFSSNVSTSGRQANIRGDPAAADRRRGTASTGSRTAR